MNVKEAVLTAPNKHLKVCGGGNTWAAARIWAGILGKFRETKFFLVPQGFRPLGMVPAIETESRSHSWRFVFYRV